MQDEIVSANAEYVSRMANSILKHLSAELPEIIDTEKTTSTEALISEICTICLEPFAQRTQVLSCSHGLEFSRMQAWLSRDAGASWARPSCRKKTVGLCEWLGDGEGHYKSYSIVEHEA
jgi:hypothetical protein